MIEQPALKNQDKGYYKGYRIEKQWAEKRGKVLDYTVNYVAYDSNNNVVCLESKLSLLKQYIDNIDNLITL